MTLLDLQSKLSLLRLVETYVILKILAFQSDSCYLTRNILAKNNLFVLVDSISVTIDTLIFVCLIALKHVCSNYIRPIVF